MVAPVDVVVENEVEREYPEDIRDDHHQGPPLFCEEAPPKKVVEACKRAAVEAHHAVVQDSYFVVPPVNVDLSEEQAQVDECQSKQYVLENTHCTLHALIEVGLVVPKGTVKDLAFPNGGV